jgi:poly(ribitol-phosphate) beta-N-acetylglucosaminyltransferase
VGGSLPDVTVIVAVYNTMPYLTACLRSLMEQTIGPDRLEIVAVDDGSTDGGGAELDRWAARHPDTIKVVHQENSGGPAGPNNLAMGLATGRYLFFVGADDYLGAEALERLVTAADELDADIVLGRMTGVGGRNVNQAVYRGGNRDDIDLVNSPLPWALSNTKLYRRRLVTHHAIDYPEELRSCSDQIFTLRAIAAARRIAVRADYEFYYAVRRADAGNITYRTTLSDFVHDGAVVMDLAADVITDPVAAERVRHRHFTWELGKLLGRRFVEAERDEQERVHAGLRKLADAYLTEPIRQKLDVRHRVRLSVCQHGTLAVASCWDGGRATPVLADGGRLYAAVPGFRDAAKGFPDDWFDATAEAHRLGLQGGPAEVSWGVHRNRSLLVRWPSMLAGDPEVRVLAGDAPAAETRLESTPAGTAIQATFALDDLIAPAGQPRRRRLRLSVTTGALSQTYNLTGSIDPSRRRVLHQRGLRCYLIEPKVDDKGLLISVTAVTPRRVIGRLAKKLRPRR